MSEPGTELAEIEHILSTEPARYWASGEMQDRYRALLAGGEPAGGPEPRAAADSPLPRLLRPSELPSSADFERYQRTHAAAADVVLSLPPGDRAGFVDSFDRLPIGAQEAALREIVASPLPGEADNEEVKRFVAANGELGRRLAREWGSDVNRRLGTMQARWWRLIGAFPSDDDCEAFDRWLTALPVSGQVAVLKRLAA